MNPDLYLDVTGVLENEKGEPNVWLLKALFENRDRFHRIFWLSTYTREGSAEALYAKHPAFKCLEATPLNWKSNKTEAIDWTRPFLWMEDGITDAERTVFYSRAGKNQSVVEIRNAILD